MGKRLNPHRRLLAAQAATLAVARLEQSRVNGVDAAKLQQGAVRSHTAGLDRKAAIRRTKDGTVVATFTEPHWTDADNPGKRKRSPKKQWSPK